MSPGRSTFVALTLLGVGCVASGTPAPQLLPADPEPARAFEPAPYLGLGRPVLRRGDYDLSQLPVFSKVLFYIRQNYVDKSRLHFLNALQGSLDFIQQDIPEVMIEYASGEQPQAITVHVNGQSQRFDSSHVDAPWSLRTTLASILRFVQANLPPLSPDEEAKRLLQIEIAATNGMLYTLDPHSVLLDADTYAAMRTRVPGPSGGTGIAISYDEDERIAVTAVVPQSPATAAGVEPQDRIVRIDGLPTANLTLDNLIDHFRGESGTKLSLELERPGEKSLRKVTVTRAEIFQSALPAPARVLTGPSPGGGVTSAAVGYLALQRFSRDAANDVRTALASFAQDHVAGVILDLRGNSGGLYREAVKVADAFIKTGTIASVVAASNRKDETATDDGIEPTVPVAVLVDRRSAAASEIVAAAIQDADRGIVVGERTFGEGSVQVLFDISSPLAPPNPLDEKTGTLGLKLTTAQWLAPSGASIQIGGVTPDIETRSQGVTQEQGQALFRLEIGPRRDESYYSRSLGSVGAVRDTRPAVVVPFLDTQPRDQNEKASGAGPDFTLDLARELVVQSASVNRQKLVQDAKTVLKARRAAEDRKLVAELGTLGVDWTRGASTSGNGQALLELTIPGQKAVRAGDTVKIRGVVVNQGNTPLHRVRTVLHAANPRFDGWELVFGKIAPGATKTAEVSVKIPDSFPTFADVLSARVTADEPLKTEEARVIVRAEGAPHPVFAFTYKTAGASPVTDNAPARTKLAVEIRNIGAVASPSVTCNLRNSVGQRGVLIDAGRFVAKQLEPGKTMICPFVYETDGFRLSTPYHFELAIDSPLLPEKVSHQISFGDAGATSGSVTPPMVSGAAPTIVTTTTAHVTGVAALAGGLRDIFITVMGLPTRSVPRKAFYLSGPRPQAQVPFAADIPVALGTNLITINARAGDGAMTSFPLMVLRTRP